MTGVDDIDKQIYRLMAPRTEYSANELYDMLAKSEPHYISKGRFSDNLKALVHSGKVRKRYNKWYIRYE